MIGTRESCHCDRCRGACQRRPGWFLPEEVKPLAEAMGIDMQELFDSHLTVEYWYGDMDLPDTFVLAPAIKGESTGSEALVDPIGNCVFYDDEIGCKIHDLGKPHECRQMLHRESPPEGAHMGVAKAWVEHQDWVKELLGREPEIPSATFGDFSSLFGAWGL